MTLEIDILYTDDCQGWPLAVEYLQQALSDLGLEADIAYWLITSDAQALDAHFPGSPTIRVNGEDLFPMPNVSPAMRLRPYFTDEGMLDYPTYSMLYDALQAWAG